MVQLPPPPPKIKNTKCTIQLFLVHAQCCATTTSSSRTGNPVPVKCHSPSPLPPSLWRPLTCFLALWICLFWTFHINGIIQHVAFWVWLILLSIMSRLIHVVVHVSSSFLFMADVPLFGCTAFCLSFPQVCKCVWVVPTFWLYE